MQVLVRKHCKPEDDNDALAIIRDMRAIKVVDKPTLPYLGQMLMLDVRD